MESKIPKNIIFVWVGNNPKPQKVLNCIETWKKHMPESEWNYIEVSEETFDINENKYCRDAYSNKKWAFVSDYLRLKALYEFGGVYMDTDVMVYQPLDKFLKHDFFTGFENVHYPVTATMGAKKGNELIKEMLDVYDNKVFETHENWHEYETNTMIMSDIIGKYFDRDRVEYQEKDNIAIYPRETFCWHEEMSNDVYTQHLMFGSWGTNQ